jgi:hypothetical protein
MSFKATIFVITLALFFQTPTSDKQSEKSDAVGCGLGSTFVLLRLKQHQVSLENLRQLGPPNAMWSLADIRTALASSQEIYLPVEGNTSILSTLTDPFIVRVMPANDMPHFIVVARKDNDRLLIYDPVATQAITVERKNFEQYIQRKFVGLISGKDFNNLNGFRNWIFIIAVVLVVIPMLTFGVKLVQSTKLRSATVIIVFVIVLGIVGCHQQDENQLPTSDEVSQIRVPFEILPDASSPVITISSRSSFDTVVQIRNISNITLNASDIVSSRPCCSSATIKSVQPESILPGNLAEVTLNATLVGNGLTTLEFGLTSKGSRGKAEVLISRKVLLLGPEYECEFSGTGNFGIVSTRNPRCTRRMMFTVKSKKGIKEVRRAVFTSDKDWVSIDPKWDLTQVESLEDVNFFQIPLEVTFTPSSMPTLGLNRFEVEAKLGNVTFENKFSVMSVDRIAVDGSDRIELVAIGGKLVRSQFFLEAADGKQYRLKSATIEGLDRLGLKVGEEGKSVHFECGDVTTEGPNLSVGKMVALLADHQGGEFTQEIPCKFLRVGQKTPTE